MGSRRRLSQLVKCCALVKLSRLMAVRCILLLALSLLTVSEGSEKPLNAIASLQVHRPIGAKKALEQSRNRQVAMIADAAEMMSHENIANLVTFLAAGANVANVSGSNRDLRGVS